MTDVGGTTRPRHDPALVATEPGLGPAVDPRVERLRECLRDGLASAGDVRSELGLSAEVEDADAARALIEAVGEGEVDRVRVSPDRRVDPRPSIRPSLVPGADASFLGRLRTERTSQGLDVADLDDVRTLVAVLRAGSLRQRRAAVRRLGMLLGEERRAIPSDQRRTATDVLAHIRDVEIAYELSEARAALPGGVGRRVLSDREEVEKVTEEIAEDVAAFWDGELASEPLSRLPGDQRANLLMRLRDLPDALVQHLGAVLEGSDGVSTREERLALLSSLRHAGDRRLVASLRIVLDTGDAELSIEAARALGNIDDPRVHPALVGAYERSVVDRNRTVLAGALGRAGDARGAEYVRTTLASDDPNVVRNALEALEAVGGTEDTDAVVRVMEAADPVLAIAAVRTLARIADARALPALREMRDRTSVSALWAELEDAEAAIRARVELRGEELEESAALKSGAGTQLAERQAPALAKLGSWKDYLVGHLWLLVGGLQRAVARFENASDRRGGWGLPLVAVAMAYARKNRYPQALAAFRRAIEVDRLRVERHPVVIRAVARCFLRRAEEVERDGRHEIARGLLEEALSLDLRRAPSALRFEVNRRHEAMRTRAGGT